MKRLKQIREELKQMANTEAKKLLRLARKAKKHGCSDELVKSIRDEASWLFEVGKSYPEELLEWDFEYMIKYSFKM